MKTGPKNPTANQIARAAAKEAGEVFYDGKPCVHGHGTRRRVSDGHCAKCEDDYHTAYRQTYQYQEYQREYQAAYRDNPEKKELLAAIGKRHVEKKRLTRWDRRPKSS